MVTVVTDESWHATDDVEKQDGWSDARVLGEYGEEPWGKLKSDEPVLPPPVYLRREFKCRGRVRRATVYTTAWGYSICISTGSA